MGKWDEHDPLYDDMNLSENEEIKINIKKVKSGKMKKTKKDKMWIVCCGCANPIEIPKTTTWIQEPKTWLSVCPFCGFKHKILIAKG